MAKLFTFALFSGAGIAGIVAITFGFLLTLVVDHEPGVDDAQQYVAPPIAERCGPERLAQFAAVCSDDLRCVHTKGYVVLRSFLSELEVQTLRTLELRRKSVLAAGRPPIDWYPARVAWHKPADVEEVAEDVVRRLEMLLLQVRNLTNDEIPVDTLWPGASGGLTDRGAGGPVAPEKGVWSQDDDCYFLGHVSYKHLMLDFAVAPAEVDVIPYDLLKECEPNLFVEAIGRGASVFVRRGDNGAEELFNDSTISPDARTVRIDLDRAPGKKASYLDFEAASHGLKLNVGDLLIRRGDAILREKNQAPANDDGSHGPFVGLRAQHSGSYVDIVHLLVGGGEHKFRSWVARGLQPDAHLAGLALASGHILTSVGTLRALEADYVQCVDYFAGRGSMCQSGVFGHVRNVVGVSLARAIVRLGTLRHEAVRLLSGEANGA